MFKPVKSADSSERVGSTPIQSITQDEKNFFESLKTATDLFNEFDRVPDDKDKRELFINDLERSFGSLYEVYKSKPKFFEKAENLHQISQLFFLLGHSVYPGQMEQSRCFFQSSLCLKLSAFGLIKENVLKILMAHASTSSLQENLKKAREHSNLSEITDLPEKILESVSIDSLKQVKDKAQLFDLSRTLRMLGGTYQNITIYYEKTKENMDRFDLIYGLAKECSKNVIDNSSSQLKKDAAWEMTELLYNTERFMYDLKNQNPSALKDVSEKIKLLDNIAPLLKDEGDTARTIQKKAQVENIKAIEKFRNKMLDEKFLTESYQHISNALQIAEDTPNFNANLLNMFRNTHLVIELEAKKDLNMEKLEQRANQILEFTQQTPNYYNPLYFMGAARLSVKMGNNDRALMMLDHATKEAEKSPENKDEMLLSIQALRDRILGVNRT